MESIKKFLKQIKWYEWLYMSVFFCIISCLSCVFNSGPLITCNSLLGILTSFFLAKGKILGNFLGIVQSSLYIVMCYNNNYYGEIIVGACFTIPVYIASIISWARNLNKTDNIVKVNKNLSWQEWLCASLGDVMFTIGIFFLLDYFNTANLIISTLSVGSCAFARYLAVRRCEYNFLFQLPNNIMRMCLWIFVIIQKGDISYITTIIQYIMYLCLNIFGAFNWIRLKKIQRLRKMVLKKRTEKLVMDKDYMKEV